MPNPIPSNALIVVADGGGGTLFRNAGAGDEAAFAKLLAQTLSAMHGRHEFEALALIPDPQTLGQVRDCMHKTVEASVVRTLAKGLANHAPADIERALSE